MLALFYDIPTLHKFVQHRGREGPNIKSVGYRISVISRIHVLIFSLMLNLLPNIRADIEYFTRYPAQIPNIWLSIQPNTVYLD